MAARTIRRLPEDVISRIAAGEVVVRPANAVKELLENALDAGSQRISITVKNGGLTLLQVRDDGEGISVDDLPSVCERFTTSKLRTFSDLMTLGTYGFRGEALASMSYVARVTITSRVKGQPAYQCKYLSGAPITSPVPCPTTTGNGTTVILEDMFYALPVRRQTLVPAEEYARILDVIQKYAIHNPLVMWSCKKSGTPIVDFQSSLHDASSMPTSLSPRLDHQHTIALPTWDIESTRAVIRNVYGATVANELLDIDLSGVRPSFSLHGLIAVPTVQPSKTTLILFINHRLVESSAVRRCIDRVVTMVLPKGCKVWCYVALTVPPECIDVNVHPTKKDVILLDFDSILDRLESELSSQLRASRVFLRGQSTALSPCLPRKTQQGEARQNVTSSVTEQRSTTPPQFRCRVDTRQVTLPTLFDMTTQDSTTPPKEVIASTSDEEQNETQRDDSSSVQLSSVRQFFVALDNHSGNSTLRIEPTVHPLCSKFEAASTASNLQSIQTLLSELQRRSSADGTQYLTHSTFVGALDASRVLLQHATKLILVNICRVFEEALYQSILRRLGALSSVRLDPPLDLATAVAQALETATMSFLRQSFTRPHLLMLADYFSCVIDPETFLVLEFPLCCGRYFPGTLHLGYTVLTIAYKTDWTAEATCLQQLASHIAAFYARLPLQNNVNGHAEQGGPASPFVKELFELVYHPALAFNPEFLCPATFLTDGTLQIVTSLEKLYRVFERC